MQFLTGKESVPIEVNCHELISELLPLVILHPYLPNPGLDGLWVSEALTK